jgi:hypothetical protein
VSQGGSGGCNRTAQGRGCADGNLRRRGLLHSAARKKFDGRVCYRTDQKLARVDAADCKQLTYPVPPSPESAVRRRDRRGNFDGPYCCGCPSGDSSFRETLLSSA